MSDVASHVLLLVMLNIHEQILAIWEKYELRFYGPWLTKPQPPKPPRKKPFHGLHSSRTAVAALL